MSRNDNTKLSIVKKFLHGDTRYLELALAIEDAVESLRDDLAKEVYPKLRGAIGNIPSRHPDRGWKATDECKQYKPLFWRRLYKDQSGWDKGQFSGVSVGRWKSERLAFEVCAEGWPAGRSSLDLDIRETFGKSVTGESAELWREDARNSDPSRRISWHFDGDRAFLIGDVEKEVARIVDLVAALAKTIDQAETPRE